jgi:gliding motility-associated-like protein
VSTGGKVVVYGLPLFYIYSQPTASLDVKGACLEDTFEFTTNLVPGQDVFTWELNTGSGFKTVSNNSYYKYRFSSPGTYYMRIINAPDTISDTITVVRCATDTLQWVIKGTCLRDTVYFSSNLKAGKDSAIWQIDEGSGYYIASRQVVFSKFFNTLAQFKVRLIGLNDTLEQTILLENCDSLQWQLKGRCYEDGLSLWSNLQYGRDSILWQLDKGSGYAFVSRLSSDKLTFDSAIVFKIRLIGFDDTLEQTVSLLDCGSSCNIKIPNVFTPNEDSLNDVFHYQTTCVLDNVELLIFNRWGEQLFESHTQGEGWNGRYYSQFCPDGLYLYILSYDDARKKRIMVNGLVHLIR